MSLKAALTSFASLAFSIRATAVAALTQENKGKYKFTTYASHRWSATNECASAMDKGRMAVLWVVVDVHPHLGGRPFPLYMDYSALIWLFRTRYLDSNL